MNSEERFKRSLEDLISSKKFPFDEANWEKASEMIAASKKTKRRFVPLILTGLMLLISGLGGFYLLNDNNSPAPGQLTEKPVSEPGSVLKRPSAGSFSGSRKISAPKEQGIRPANTETTKMPVNSVQKEIRTLPLENIVPEKVDLPGTTEKTEPVKNGPHVSHTSSNVPVKESSLAPETKLTAPHQIAVSVNAAVPEKIATEDKQVSQSEEKVLGAAATQEIVKVAAGKHLTSNEAGPETEKTTSGLNSQNEEMIPAVASDDIVPATGTIVAEKETDKASPVAEDPSHAGTLLVNESTETITAIDLGEIGKPKDLPTLFSIEAGASYLYGWQNPAGRDADGFNLVLGMNYFNHITSKMAFSYGIQYTSTGNLGFSSHSTKITRLNLGEESKITVFTPVKVHYLVVPLRFNYAVNPMNTIGLGCNAAYLLTVESEVETFDQKLNVRSESVVTKETGYTEGFREFDIQASVFYKRRLYPNLSVNAEIFYGLSDVKNNAFFKLDAFERNTGIKLTLVYTILKK